jgi:superfamily II DNA/RNA helicase
VVVLCHTRELAYQICHEYERFTTYMKVGGRRCGRCWQATAVSHVFLLPALNC